MSQLVKRLISSGIANSNSIKGCNINEINNLESILNIKLPTMYKSFLLVMGHRAGSFYVGTDMFYNSLFDIQKWARELLVEDGSPFILPCDTFILSMHQGYQFTYFRTDEENDDPPVYYYMEGSGIPEKKWLKFSDYLLQSVIEHENIFRR
ncbi:MAG: SMI1/KNR4 family protein [Blastocatellia bacterium]|nr:SMI1/KNR4 family protein [Blastocatellia bacterium]